MVRWICLWFTYLPVPEMHLDNASTQHGPKQWNTHTHTHTRSLHCPNNSNLPLQVMLFFRFFTFKNKIRQNNNKNIQRMAFKGKANLWTLSGVQMHYLAHVTAHQITRTFSSAFEKGETGKVQNQIGTKMKILLKIIVESVLFKWPRVSSCLISTNYLDSWEN